MPPTHTTEGLEAARTIREEFPQVAILLLRAHIEVEHAMDLLGAGPGMVRAEDAATSRPGACAWRPHVTRSKG